MFGVFRRKSGGTVGPSDSYISHSASLLCIPFRVDLNAAGGLVGTGRAPR